jgi:GxxExxY protein
MTHNELSSIIIEAAIDIHRRLGPGMLESVYQTILAHELTKRGLTVEKETPVPLVWDNLRFDVGFRADLIVNGMILIELKSVEQVAPVHKKQVLTYLRLTDKKLGLLINFGEELLKDGVIVSSMVTSMPVSSDHYLLLCASVPPCEISAGA